MRQTRAVIDLACLLTLLAGCTTSMDASGHTVIATPTIAQMLGIRNASANGFVGTGRSMPGRALRYEARNGGKTTSLVLTRRNGATWLVHVEMGQTDCMGIVDAVATETAPGHLSIARDSMGNVCRLNIDETAETASIGEMGCFMNHGAACEFAGVLARTN